MSIGKGLIKKKQDNNEIFRHHHKNTRYKCIPKNVSLNKDNKCCLINWSTKNEWSNNLMTNKISWKVKIEYTERA